MRGDGEGIVNIECCGNYSWRGRRVVGLTHKTSKAPAKATIPTFFSPFSKNLNPQLKFMLQKIPPCMYRGRRCCFGVARKIRCRWQFSFSIAISTSHSRRGSFPEKETIIMSSNKILIKIFGVSHMESASRVRKSMWNLLRYQSEWEGDVRHNILRIFIGVARERFYRRWKMRKYLKQ